MVLWRSGSRRRIMHHTSIGSVEGGVADTAGRKFTSFKIGVANHPQWRRLGTVQWTVGICAATIDVFDDAICHLWSGQGGAGQQNLITRENIVGGSGGCYRWPHWHTGRSRQCSYAERYENAEGAAQEVSIDIRRCCSIFVTTHFLLVCIVEWFDDHMAFVSACHCPKYGWQNIQFSYVTRHNALQSSWLCFLFFYCSAII